MSALLTTGAVTLHRGTASGNLVEARDSKNWLPDLVLGKGPTQSTITLSNGSPITGMGQSGAGGTAWLGFPVI